MSVPEYVSIGAAFDALGDNERSRPIWEEAAKRAAKGSSLDAEVAWRNFAWSRFDHKDVSGGREAIERALALRPPTVD